MPIDRRNDKEVVVHIYNGILLLLIEHVCADDSDVSSHLIVPTSL